MQRDISFRAWSKLDKKMFLDVGVIDNMAVINTKSHGIYPIKGETILMQYTGLKDLKGVKIYEGDIITYPYSDTLTLTMEVEWQNAGFYICESVVYYRPDKWLGRLAEVIGNIYENPKLLKSQT